MQFLLWIIVGLAGGWMTGKNMRGYGSGPLMDSAMGIAGGVTGGFIMRSTGSPGYAGIFYTTLVAILSAILLTAFMGVAGGKKPIRLSAR
jgi:uncharacterized membrane protein YeaQ/YmgE (transglycosylase-associated protein family)